MLAAPDRSSSPFNVVLVFGLTVVMVGAMAFAVPAGPIEAKTGARGGVMIGHGRLSELQADLWAREGYAFLVVDFTGADMGDGAFWREPLGRIAQRGFPLWAHVALGARATNARRAASLEAAQTLATREHIQVLILSGEGAAAEARVIGSASRVRVIAVVPPGVELEERAVIVGPDEVSNLPGVLPIVRAGRLSGVERREARSLVEQRTDGEYIFALSAIR